MCFYYYPFIIFREKRDKLSMVFETQQYGTLSTDLEIMILPGLMMMSFSPWRVQVDVNEEKTILNVKSRRHYRQTQDF
jgi:hypothetical protein